MQTVHLFNVLTICGGDLGAFYTHFGVIVRPFPDIGETSRGDWVIANSDEASGNDMRRWQDPMMGANGLQFV